MTHDTGRKLRISIVTPCYNAERYIAETVESVLGQSAVKRGRIELEYIVCDGGSQDGTVGLVQRGAGSRVQVVSEPDTGMYDALAKGLRRCTGDVVAYINAGDYYHPNAFEVVADLLESGDIQWLTGYSVTYSERGDVTRVVLPYRYRRALIAAGAYDGIILPFIQQESTFWRRELLATVDFDRLASCKLAGDAYLWMRFASKSELHIVESYLGGFRRHRGQLSEARDAYAHELQTLAQPMSAMLRIQARIDALAWRSPPRTKKYFNQRLLLRFDEQSYQWK